MGTKIWMQTNFGTKSMNVLFGPSWLRKTPTHEVEMLFGKTLRLEPCIWKSTELSHESFRLDTLRVDIGGETLRVDSKFKQRFNQIEFIFLVK